MKSTLETGCGNTAFFSFSNLKQRLESKILFQSIFGEKKSNNFLSINLTIKLTVGGTRGYIDF